MQKIIQSRKIINLGNLPTFPRLRTVVNPDLCIPKSTFSLNEKLPPSSTMLEYNWQVRVVS